MNQRNIYKRLALFALAIIGFALFMEAFSVKTEAEETVNTMKILSIGNSYSVDMQTYVNAMAKKAGYNLEVVNAYVSGCSVKMHVEYYNSMAMSYRLYKNNQVIDSAVTLKRALEYDTYDYVTLQNGTSGYTDVTPPVEGYIEQLVAIVKQYQPNAKIVWNFCWADAGRTSLDDSQPKVRAVLKNVFGGDREKMLEAYTADAEYCRKVEGIDYVNPISDVFEAAFREYGGLLSRDGYHMSERGRYLLACEWLAFFLGIEAPADYVPVGYSYSSSGNMEVPDEETREHLRAYAYDTIAAYADKPVEMKAREESETESVQESVQELSAETDNESAEEDSADSESGSRQPVIIAVIAAVAAVVLALAIILFAKKKKEKK